MISRETFFPLKLYFGITIFFVILLLSIMSIFWTPHQIEILDINNRFIPFGDSKFIFGTDHFGRDIFSMIMVGAKNTLFIAFISLLIGLSFGVPLGLISASFLNKTIDDVIMRSNDILFAFPAIVTAIMITSTFGPSATNAIIAVGIFNIPVFARLVRASSLPIFEQQFIMAAKASGKGPLRISVEHILPNISNLIIIQCTIQFSIGILAESGLSYIGLGAQPPTVSLGKMLAESQTMVSFAPNLAIMPGIALFLTILSINFIGDGLRDLNEDKQ